MSLVIGEDTEGNKELLAVSDGPREGKLCWKNVFLSLREIGLEINPSLAIRDSEPKNEALKNAA
jgi:transposase-like protein